ncbi:MAG: 5-methyltetrahydrofolate--homocysteine methyltransferase [Deltaproteobacteria bacterium]|nr:MAG: 5-methyltetrahydrofolate--homocysteine methyltransferase [Deltaproteobacteria bacterium]
MTFLEAVKNQILVVDGAMGTMVHNLGLSPADFGGEAFEMLSDLLVFSRPGALKEIHLAYFRAGANAVETNTFGASPLRLQEFDFSVLDTAAFDPIPYGLDLNRLSVEDMAYWLSRVGAEIARDAVATFQASADHDGRPLFVLGSIGPSNVVLSPTHADLRTGTWEMIAANFAHQVRGLIDGGADVLLFETQQDALELKAAVAGALAVMKEKGVRLPIMAQVTVDAHTRMQIFGTDILSALTTLQGIGVDVFGINCSIGPDLMEPTVAKLSRHCRLPISVIPNAGMPESENGRTVYKLDPETFAEQLGRYVDTYGIQLVGGCCGTTPDHIRALVRTVKGKTPVHREIDPTTYISGPQNAVAVDGSRELIRIGERLNVRGSKKVREAVENEAGVIDFESLEAVVADQVRDLGLGIIDVCMDSNRVDTQMVLPEVIRAMTVDMPAAMCIDSFDADALVAGMQVYPGRAIVNSISMESHGDAGTKADYVVARTAFHAPLYIGLAADDDGPATTREKKVEIARRMIETCAEYGVSGDQLLVDINAFPIGSESVEGMNFALESLEAIPQIKALYPGIRTTIGVSNLTNGLAKKPYMRVVLTSVFLDEGRKRGLDAAIVNPNHYVPVESLDSGDYALGLKVVLERDMDAYAELETIAEVKQGRRVVKRKTYDDLAPADAIREKIIDGIKSRKPGTVTVGTFTYAYHDAIVELAAEAVQTHAPLTLINDYLMAAMETLGERFAAGEASLPHLLKSADVMKQVMGFLEGLIKAEQGESGALSRKGTIVLGTIYQDVHSIGKDLVKTLLENYGYRVIDLGVQVPLEAYIRAAQEEKADAIGMSALLVQTANHMITVARMMEAEGLDIPIFIGGAPVNTRHAAFVAMRGQEDVDKIKPDVFYASSAMDSVNLLESLMSDRRDELIAANRNVLVARYLAARDKRSESEALLETLPPRRVSFDGPPAAVNDLGIRTDVIRLTEMHLNEKGLFGLNWKMGGQHLWEKKGISREDVVALKNEWIQAADKNGWIRPSGITALYPCFRSGDTLRVLSPEDRVTVIAEINTRRMLGKQEADTVAIADYFRSEDAGAPDLIGFQIATAGPVSAEQIARFKAEGDSESAHLLQGLSDRCAEDLAMMLHKQLRQQAGAGVNTGKRYSPGYPGLDLAVNREIYRLLSADSVGIGLTEAGEFTPTSTTSALVCFHPEAAYE